MRCFSYMEIIKIEASSRWRLVIIIIFLKKGFY